MVVTNTLINGIDADLHARISTNCPNVHFGSGTATPAATDTDLDTEESNQAREDYYNLNNVSVISGYLDTATGNSTTYREAGFGTGTSGGLQTRFLITEIFKTSSKELWIDNEIVSEYTQEDS